MRKTTLCLFVLVIAASQHSAIAEERSARMIAEEMLNHLGSPTEWADAQSARIMEVHITQWARLPYTHEVWVDFSAPRVLVRVKNQDLRQLRSMNKENGWWIQEGSIAPYTAEFLEDEFERWRGSPYRIISMIARDDNALGYEMVADDVLQISIDSEAVIQFLLDEQNRPIGFSRYNDDFELITFMEPLDQYGDVNLWREVRNQESTFRSLNLEFELSTKPPSISFDPPEDLNDLTR